MYDNLLCRHEAGHAVVGAALGLRHVARVKENGEGFVSWDDGALSALTPFDRAVVAVSGNVAECMAIDGNLKRAVSDTLTYDSTDAAIFQMAVRELPAWKYSPHGPALAAAAKARSIIQENRAEFDRLTAALQRDGIGQVRIPSGTSEAVRPVLPTSRPTARGVDYAANLVALRGGQVAGLAELRSMASEAKAAGHKNMAVLLERSIAAAEGREVEPLYERSYGGSVYVVTR